MADDNEIKNPEAVLMTIRVPLKDKKALEKYAAERKITLSSAARELMFRNPALISSPGGENGRAELRQTNYASVQNMRSAFKKLVSEISGFISRYGSVPGYEKMTAESINKSLLEIQSVLNVHALKHGAPEVHIVAKSGGGKDDGNGVRSPMGSYMQKIVAFGRIKDGTREFETRSGAKKTAFTLVCPRTTKDAVRKTYYDVSVDWSRELASSLQADSLVLVTGDLCAAMNEGRDGKKYQDLDIWADSAVVADGSDDGLQKIAVTGEVVGGVDVFETKSNSKRIGFRMSCLRISKGETVESFYDVSARYDDNTSILIVPGSLVTVFGDVAVSNDGESLTMRIIADKVIVDSKKG